ncbi:MAG: hypothetical protein EOP08_16765 [Proteobacteria bacterium]|nr:MAG: hypothetical protein EOP08_16765 [Pseudomonadota bacterium]
MDDICTATAVGRGVFDPDCVYIVGSLRTGSANAGIVFHPERPTDYAGAAYFALSNAVIRPTDGRLLYETSAKEEPGDPDPSGYKLFTYLGPSSPNASLEARERVPGIVCDGSFRQGFWVFPDDGAVLYDCDDALMVAGTAAPIYRGDARPIAPAYGRAVLAMQSPRRFVWIRDGVASDVDAIEGDFHALRARPSGSMWLASSRWRDEKLVSELYEIAPNGSIRVLGEYQNADDPRWGIPGNACALEPDQSLVCRFTTTADTIDRVFRLTFTEKPVMIFDESLHEQKIHGGGLITGP